MIMNIQHLDKKIELVSEVREAADIVGKRIIKSIDNWQGHLTEEEGYYTSKHLIIGKRVVKLWREKIIREKMLRALSLQLSGGCLEKTGLVTTFGENSSIATDPPQDERKPSGYVKGAFLQKGKVNSAAENEVSNRFPPISEEEENKAIPEESGPGSGISRNNDSAMKRDSSSAMPGSGPKTPK